MALTNRQKAALAGEVINRVADIVEFRSEIITDPELADVSLLEIAAQLSTWLKGLPGDSWDTRLDLHLMDGAS